MSPAPPVRTSHHLRPFSLKRTLLDQVRTSRLLRVAIAPDIPGMAEWNRSAAAWEGFEVDLARRIARELIGASAEPVFIRVPLADRVSTLVRGRADVVMASFAVTEERQRSVDFAGAYATSSHAAIRSSRSPVVGELEDLNGLTVAVVRGSSDVDVLVEVAPGARILEVDGPTDGIASIRTAQADVFWATAKTATLEQVRRPGEMLVRSRVSHGLETWAVGIPKGEPELKAEIDHIVSSLRSAGELDRLAERWLTPPMLLCGDVSPVVRRSLPGVS